MVLGRLVLHLDGDQHRVSGKTATDLVERRPRLPKLALQQLRALQPEVEVRDGRVHCRRAGEEAFGNREPTLDTIDEREVVQGTHVVRRAIEKATVRVDGLIVR